MNYDRILYLQIGELETECRQQKIIDVLVTSQWPSMVDAFGVKPVRN